MGSLESPPLSLEMGFGLRFTSTEIDGFKSIG
jgi:hypothetical protein